MNNMQNVSTAKNEMMLKNRPAVEQNELGAVIAAKPRQLTPRQRGTLTVALMLASALSPLMAHAALPTTAPPSRGATAGNYLKLLQDYGYDAALVAGLLLSAYALFKVAGGALVIYHEVQEGKKKWGDMGMHVLVGVGLLMFIVYIVTQASGVL